MEGVSYPSYHIPLEGVTSLIPSDHVLFVCVRVCIIFHHPYNRNLLNYRGAESIWKINYLFNIYNLVIYQLFVYLMLLDG